MTSDHHPHTWQTAAPPPAPRRRRRWLVWVLVALAVGAVLIIVSSSPRPPGPGPTLLPTITAGPILADPPPLQVARDVAYGKPVDYDGWQVTTGAPTAASGALGPVWCTTVAYVNNTDEPHPFNSLDWQSRDAAGADTASSFARITAPDALRSGDLQPGGTTGGSVCFDRRGPVPPAAIVYRGLQLLAHDPATWHAA